MTLALLVAAKQMTSTAWIFMGVMWTIIIVLTFWCFSRLLSAKKK